MASPTPPPPNEVPETAATYERTNIDNALKRDEAQSASNPAGSPIGGARTGPKDDLQSSASTPMQTSLQRSDADRPSPLPAGGKIVGSVKTEEPLGWDQAPTDIKDPRQQRHPRPDGVGGSEPDSAKRNPER